MNINLPELRADLEDAYALLAPIDDILAQKACEKIDSVLKALPPPDWLTEDEARERLSIMSWEVLRLLVHYQGLKYELLGNRMWIPPDELDRISNAILQEVWDREDDRPPPEMRPIRENIMAQRIAKGIQ
jgi:hypothetical protein